MLLAIDTSGPDCAVALYDHARNHFLAERVETLGRGHAERLMPLIELCLSDAGKSWEDVTRLAVARGPGSFTGLRVGLSAARGLALALRVPCVGVTVFEAMWHHEQPTGILTVLMDAKRDQCWMQSFNADGTSLGDAQAVAIESIANELPDRVTHLAGSGTLIANLPEGLVRLNTFSSAPIQSVAIVGALLEDEGNRPDPLYLRGADAKPQKTIGLVRS